MRSNLFAPLGAGKLGRSVGWGNGLILSCILCDNEVD